MPGGSRTTRLDWGEVITITFISAFQTPSPFPLPSLPSFETDPPKKPTKKRKGVPLSTPTPRAKRKRLKEGGVINRPASPSTPTPKEEGRQPE